MASPEATKRRKFEFDPKLNVFFGFNGTGKTSLLKILVSAIQDDTNLARQVPFTRATVTFLAADGKTICKRSTSAEAINAVPIQQQQPFQLATGQLFFPMIGPQPGWTYEEGPSGSQPCVYLSIMRMLGDQYIGIVNQTQPLGDATFNQMFVQLVFQRWQTYSNQQLSEIRRIQETGLAEILGSLFTSPDASRPSNKIDANTAYQEARNFLRRQSVNLSVSKSEFTQAYESDPKLQAAVTDIDEVERLVSRLEQPRKRLEELVNEFLSEGKRIEFQEGQILFFNNKEALPLEVLSSGEKQLLRIFLETLAASQAPVVIDEPELSMHIDWQQQMISAMATLNPESQLILATHSPDIMAEVPDRNIIRL